MNIKHLVFLALGFGLMACGDSSKKSGSTTGESSTHEASLDLKDIETLQASYIECKEASTEQHGCKEFVSLAVSKYYGYDFMGASGEFLAYDKLHNAISLSATWEKVGAANQQQVLNKAQANANKGIPTLAVSGSGTKSIAIVVKGELAHSNSMGLDCPSVAVFRPRRFKKSFVGKGINYAWSNLDDVVIYSLK